MRSKLLAVVTALALASGWALAADPYLDLPVEPNQPWPAPVSTLTVVTVVVTTAPKPVPPLAPKVPTPTAPLPPELPPPAIYGHDLESTSASLVYVLDISGSMDLTDGTSESRLERARAALTASVRSLPRNFRFEVLAYDCLAYNCFATLRPATDANRDQAVAWLTQLRAGGATGTGPAVVAALILDRSNKLIVVLTDGAPNCGAGPGEDNDPMTLEAHLSQVRGANGQRARVDVFAVRATGSFRDFCRNLAAQNGGTCTEVR